MKVIHVIIGLNVGGAELMLLRLSESFNNDVGQDHYIMVNWERSFEQKGAMLLR
jgi:hypothetical protein